MTVGIFFFVTNIHNFSFLTQEKSMLVAKGRASASMTESIGQYLGVVNFKLPSNFAYIVGATFSAKTLGLRFKLISTK